MVLEALFDGGKGNHMTHETTAFYLSLSLSLHGFGSWSKIGREADRDTR